MARKTPPRDSKGRFTKRGRASSRKRRSTRRKNPSRAAARRTANSMPRDASGRFLPTSGASRSRTRYRRNPPALGGRMVRTVTDAGIGAVQLTAGKAASRALPGLVNLPQGGPVGVAIRAGAAVLVGLTADQVLGGRLGERLLEGGLQGCVEDLVVGYQIPFIGPALARAPGMVVAGGTTGRYTGVGPSNALRAYIPPSRTFGRYTGGGNWLAQDRTEEVYHRA